MAGKNIQFRVSDELAAQLEELSEEAKIRGAKNASPNKLARALMQAAIGIPTKKIAAFEALIQAYAVKQNFGNRLGELIADNLDELLDSTSDSG